MPDVDAVVIGAGIVGIASARALAMAGRSVMLLERSVEFGSATSSRNSEVIHAGIYYPTGSEKARLCVEGKRLLYAYCEARGVPYRRSGKLIFAAHDGQADELGALQHKAAANGVEDIVLLDAKAVRTLEPALDCVAALSSPSTGIVDVHALMLALLGEAEAYGATYVGQTEVVAVGREAGDWQIFIKGSDTPVISTRCIVNAAGLGAQIVAGKIESLAIKHIPPQYFAKGVYFSYSGKVPFSRLIYPLPEPGGLGLHLTLDLGNQARFGPDVEWVAGIDYSVDDRRKPAFVDAARRIWPAIDPEKLIPGYAGIRPKISGPNDPVADFMISGPDDHGCEGLVNLFGIESPGVTASLAIGNRVAEALR